MASVRASIAWWQRDARLRFFVIGGWNTAFGYACYVALYALAGRRIDYLVIGVLAHVVAMLNAFTLHRVFVFRSRGPLLADFVRFNLSQVLVFAFGLAGLWCLVSLMRIEPVVAQALVTLAAVALSFLMHRHFTFRDALHRPSAP